MARDVRAGRAFIEMFIKDDKMARQMRTMQRRLTRVGVSVGKVSAAFTALGVAAGTVAAAAIIKATNAAGDFAETVSKFETVFGARANPVREWADDTAAALGVTRKEMLSTLSGFQDLFVPMGIEESVAEEMSKSLAKLSVDLASFNNMNSADVVRDLQAAMTGSSETMKKYGSIVTATAVKQELLNKKIDPKSATEAEKAMARLEIIMRTTTAAHDDAIRTQDSWNNSMKRMRTATQETLVEMGDKFLPLFKSLGPIVVEGMQQLQKAVAENMPEFDAIDDAALEAAKSGKWAEAGRLIGQGISLGIREAIGPTAHDILFRGPGAVAATGRFLAGAAMTSAPPGMQFAGSAIGRGVGGFGDALGRLQEQNTAQLQADLRNEAYIQTRLLEKQLEAQQRTNQAIENGDGGTFE